MLRQFQSFNVPEDEESDFIEYVQTVSPKKEPPLPTPLKHDTTHSDRLIQFLASIYPDRENLQRLITKQCQPTTKPSNSPTPTQLPRPRRFLSNTGLHPNVKRIQLTLCPSIKDVESRIESILLGYKSKLKSNERLIRDNLALKSRTVNCLDRTFTGSLGEIPPARKLYPINIVPVERQHIHRPEAKYRKGNSLLLELNKRLPGEQEPRKQETSVIELKVKQHLLDIRKEPSLLPPHTQKIYSQSVKRKRKLKKLRPSPY